jgi:hypothetical protein
LGRGGLGGFDGSIPTATAEEVGFNISYYEKGEDRKKGGMTDKHIACADDRIPEFFIIIFSHRFQIAVSWYLLLKFLSVFTTKADDYRSEGALR